MVGKLDDSNFLYRVLVTKIDFVGGALESDPPNPKNSIRGRIVTAGMNRFTDEEELPVFWPLFPYDVMPIKEGEHAYVIFEDNINKTHGLWITRIPENKNVDQLNLVPGEKKYEQNKKQNDDSGALTKRAADTELQIKQPEQSEDFTKEEVPEFTPRVGDRVVQGSNNTLVLLSRDRTSDSSSGKKDKSGTIFLTARSKGKK